MYTAAQLNLVTTEDFCVFLAQPNKLLFLLQAQMELVPSTEAPLQSHRLGLAQTGVSIYDEMLYDTVICTVVHSH